MPFALSYEEPSLVHLLVISSFLYLLNVARILADYLLYAGLVAEIAFGIIYGSPLAALLPSDWETTFTALGYLVLILVVFEGGLSTNLPLLLSNLLLSFICALTGICIPIAFSFALLNAGFGYRLLEAFAAGAALSSTSLGTTLAALNSVTKSSSTSSKPDNPSSQATLSTGSELLSERSNASTPTLPSEPSLQQSRIGTVLISAAIIDDVIGLVIASLIPALASVNSGSSNTEHGKLAWTIVRPLLSSFLIAVVASVVGRFVLRRLFWCHCIGERCCAPAREGKPWGVLSLSTVQNGWGTEMHADAVKLFFMVAAMSGMAAITKYTGTSVLYGAYITGLVLTYISRPPPSPVADEFAAKEEEEYRARELSFEHTFSRTIGPLQNYFLLPVFFASIGFAVPFVDLWNPTVLWRGIVYSILMWLAKLAVGFPILFYPATLSFVSRVLDHIRKLVALLREMPRHLRASIPRSPHRSRSSSSGHPAPPHNSDPDNGSVDVEKRNSTAPKGQAVDNKPLLHQTIASVPPAVFMGVAMVSRGEIGLLIAQLAHKVQKGDSSDVSVSGLLGDEAFLVCMWAILLCTLVGPITVGVVVRRWGPKVSAGIWA